jgi:TetR/AcrR family transcriptional repressor of nem operon
MVGRPREFDFDEALDSAMHAFWATGYEATSMADLMAATGLHKGSLYQTFGDKHSLFIAALRKYLGGMRQHKNELLEQAATPLEGIRNVAHGMVDMADGDSECPKGCMVINSVVELAPRDPEVKAILVEHMTLMRQSLVEVLTKGQALGEIDAQRPAELIAGLLMTFMAGLGTNLKGPMQMEEAHQLLDQQLAIIL